jgi:hypothetical protein
MLWEGVEQARRGIFFLITPYSVTYAICREMKLLLSTLWKDLFESLIIFSDPFERFTRKQN